MADCRTFRSGKEQIRYRKMLATALNLSLRKRNHLNFSIYIASRLRDEYGTAVGVANRGHTDDGVTWRVTVVDCGDYTNNLIFWHRFSSLPRATNSLPSIDRFLCSWPTRSWRTGVREHLPPVDVWLLLRLVMAVRVGIQFFRFGFLGCNLKIVVVGRPF